MTATLRSWAERVMRPLTFKRQLPAPFDAASIYVSPSASLAFAFKPMRSIDPALLRCAAQFVRPGAIVWDIGANVGLFTAAAAVRAGAEGHVIAFEPDVWLVQLLRRSADIHSPSIAPVTIVPAAVGGAIAVRAFNIAARGRASNALAEYGHSQMGGVAQRQFVPAFNLDWLLTQFPAPDLIKIDVEGAEVEALQGQRRMLDEIRPVFICEVSSKNRAAITDIFSTARYRLFDGDKPFDVGQPVAGAAWNTVAVPEEETAAFADHI
jgi:FkbM family methyltransferase